MTRPRIMPPVYLLVAILGMIALHYTWPYAQLITGFWRWIGVVPITVGLGLIVSVARVFKHRGTTIRPGEVSTQLVTGGPFGVSRNPIYVGMVCILAGIAIALGSLTPWLLIPLFVLVLTRNVIPVEEQMLEAAFGESYAQYRAAVRRWI
jgi:protein-S-isoprenylcysteine O-methyltransferase Ste14